MSDPFDRDPDDFLDDPASPYEEGTLDTTPESPEAPSPEQYDTATSLDASDVDPAVRKLFWKLVLGVKFLLLSLTLGLLFLFLGDRTVLGGQLLVFGLLLAGYVFYQYRQGKARLESGEIGSTDDEKADGGGENGSGGDS